MPRVFINHSSLDYERVEHEIISPLREYGVETWYSTNSIKSASEWERQIFTGLKESDWFLIVLTPRSVTSEWVAREVHWAFLKRKDRIIPVMLETCEPDDLHLGLLPLQFIDFRYEVAAAQDRLLAIWGLDKATQIETRYHAAREALAQEDWGTAIPHLESVLRLDPANLQVEAELNHARQQQELGALYDSGLTHLRAERWREALKSFRRVRAIDKSYRGINDLIAEADAGLEEEEVQRPERERQERKAQVSAQIERAETEMKSLHEKPQPELREQEPRAGTEAEQTHRVMPESRLNNFQFEAGRDVKLFDNSSRRRTRQLGLLVVVLLIAVVAFYAGAFLKEKISFLATKVQPVQTTEEPFVQFERTRRQVDSDPRTWLANDIGKELINSGVQNPLDSPNAEFLCLYGRANLLVGNLDEAGKAFDAAITRSDANPTPGNVTIKKEAIIGFATITTRTQKDRWKTLNYVEQLTEPDANTNAP